MWEYLCHRNQASAMNQDYYFLWLQLVVNHLSALRAHHGNPISFCHLLVQEQVYLLPRIQPNEEGASLTLPICKYYLWELDVTRNSTRAQAKLSQGKFMKTQKLKKQVGATKSSTKFGANIFFFLQLTATSHLFLLIKSLIFFCIVSDQSGKWEKVMAHHSSTLAWKIPWTEEPGRLQSMGSLRVGHD